MSDQPLRDRIAAEVRAALEKEGSGHDWWHVDRVRKNACRIWRSTGGDIQVIELASLLHDIADWKAHGGDTEKGPTVAEEILERHEVPYIATLHICDIIRTMSFKGGGVPDEMKTLEGKVVQDADRLDAIGAIGIARTFAYGGHKGRPLYDPSYAPKIHATPEEYFHGEGGTIAHFYEKLLLLKDRMNTFPARQMAEERHAFMEQFLREFYREIEGEA